jgi:hypothetical protein
VAHLMARPRGVQTSAMDGQAAVRCSYQRSACNPDRSVRESSGSADGFQRYTARTSVTCA